MTHSIKILQLENVNEILAFERQRLAATMGEVPPFIEWNAPWRQEALEHYIPLGWSFGLWDETTGQLAGYFVGQVILFFAGKTQSLWIEHLRAVDGKVESDLRGLARSLAREKHIQNLLICGSDDKSGAFPSVDLVATTRYQNLE